MYDFFPKQQKYSNFLFFCFSMLRFSPSTVLYSEMNQEQFKKEIAPLRNRLVAYAQHLTDNKDDAEDVTQEVFLKLWFIQNKLDDYKDIPALAFTIAKHLSLNMIKHKKTECEDLDEQWRSEDLSPLQELENKDEIERLLVFIDSLPDLQQSILLMKHVEGLETEEIASLSGCSIEAVRMNLSRARKKVRELFFKMK
jgi:RNA polymerase sigma-70 factor (ECF subfamily)